MNNIKRIKKPFKFQGFIYLPCTLKKENEDEVVMETQLGKITMARRFSGISANDLWHKKVDYNIPTKRTFSPVSLKTNKYHSQSAKYKDYVYDSKKEASYAAELDLRIKAKEIKSWTRQFKIEIRVNNIHICNYYIDFVVIFADNHVEYHEVKGFETDLWKMKWKLAIATHPDWKFVLIK